LRPRALEQVPNRLETSSLATTGLDADRACSAEGLRPAMIASQRTVGGLMRPLDDCAYIFKPAKNTNYFGARGYRTT
jgi:hypothetical protein